MTKLEIENTYSDLSVKERQAAVIREMLPFFFYAALPIILTITIAKIFGPAH